MRTVLVLLATVFGLAAMMLGLLGDGAAALAVFALGWAACNTAVLVPGEADE